MSNRSPKDIHRLSHCSLPLGVNDDGSQISAGAGSSWLHPPTEAAHSSHEGPDLMGSIGEASPEHSTIWMESEQWSPSSHENWSPAPPSYPPPQISDWPEGPASYPPSTDVDWESALASSHGHFKEAPEYVPAFGDAPDYALTETFNKPTMAPLPLYRCPIWMDIIRCTLKDVHHMSSSINVR